MASLARRIWRERRRTGLVAGLAAISGALFYSHIPATVAGIPLPLFIGALYGIAFGLATLTVSLIAPRLRFAMEAFALARLLYALAAAAVPGIAYAAITTPLLNATVVVLGGIAIARLACTAPVTRLRRPATVTLRLAAGAPASLAPALPALARMGYAPGPRPPRPPPRRRARRLPHGRAPDRGPPRRHAPRHARDRPRGGLDRRHPRPPRRRLPHARRAGPR